ncbi:MAG: hypothetical protein KDA41_11665 [Planctomycetales bacterium]|nr:hypothetical protein [Planctomycetales bacterium]
MTKITRTLALALAFAACTMIASTAMAGKPGGKPYSNSSSQSYGKQQFTQSSQQFTQSYQFVPSQSFNNSKLNNWQPKYSNQTMIYSQNGGYGLQNNGYGLQNNGYILQSNGFSTQSYGGQGTIYLQNNGKGKQHCTPTQGTTILRSSSYGFGY